MMGFSKFHYLDPVVEHHLSYSGYSELLSHLPVCPTSMSCYTETFISMNDIVSQIAAVLHILHRTGLPQVLSLDTV